MEEGNTKKMNKDISDFMLSEYQHIADAHFETAKQISSFFRYYLLIVSAPAFFILFFDKNPEKVEKLLKGDDIGINVFLCVVFCTISVIGFFVCVYIMNIKFNNVLYARTVNGIRKYFQETTSAVVNNFLVLSTDTAFPPYFQWSFLVIIMSFTIINSAFVFFAFWVIGNITLSVVLSIIFFATHILTYLYWGKNRNKNK